MKILYLILSVVAAGLIAFNITKIDLNEPFIGQSMIAIITILASLCVILIMMILGVSKRIEQQVKKHR